MDRPNVWHKPRFHRVEKHRVGAFFQNVVPFRWIYVSLCLYLGLALWCEQVVAGHDLAVYGEIPLAKSLGIPLDQGTGMAHGIVYYQYTDQKHVGQGNQLRVGLNTETVWLAWDLGATSGRPFVLSPYLKGQFGFAEMTPGYIRAGQHLRELSFLSLYGEAGIEMRWKLISSLFLSGHVAFRYWFFLHSPESQRAGMILPLNSPALRSSLSLSWERMNTWVLRGRLRQGFRFQATAAIHRRWEQRSWGGLHTETVDLRNQNFFAAPNLQLTAHADAAIVVHPRIGISLDATAATGWFADDLYRFKVGGDNDYIPMLSGTYFAEFVVDSFFLAHLRLWFVPWTWWRIVPQIDLAWIPDVLRQGQAMNHRWIVGLGLNLDFFIRDNIRIHIKGSYAPNAPRPTQDGGVKVMVGFIAHWW